MPKAHGLPRAASRRLHRARSECLYSVADGSPPNKSRKSCKISGKKLENNKSTSSPKIAVIFVLANRDFTTWFSSGYRMKHSELNSKTNASEDPFQEKEKKYPPRAGIKKCGNHLLSPFDYHRPCRLNFRVRNGDGCITARIFTARDRIQTPLSRSSTRQEFFRKLA